MALPAAGLSVTSPRTCGLSTSIPNASNTGSVTSSPLLLNTSTPIGSCTNSNLTLSMLHQRTHKGVAHKGVCNCTVVQRTHSGNVDRKGCYCCCSCPFIYLLLLFVRPKLRQVTPWCLAHN